MGPGIFTKYSKQVIGGLIVIFASFAVCTLYFQLRGNVGGVSPYETVNDLYEQGLLSMTTDQASYSTDVASITVTLRNDAPDYILIQGEPHTDEWALERKVDGSWRSLRTQWKEPVRWGMYAGGVDWNGGEEDYLCNISDYYKTPLETGTYRIVFPNMIHMTQGHLAVEFTIE